MNFYKHHLGDYDGATAHLSWDEDMAYTRLLRAYYRTERPIPIGQEYRLARAQGKSPRAAVDSVLAEFFNQQEDGWHNKRADEEIEAYQAQAETNRRIAQARTRQRTVNEPLNESSTKRVPNHKPEPETRTRGTPLPAAPDPDWLPPEFVAYEQHRREKREKLTPTARQACIAKLGRWREQGHDIAAVIRRSIDNGYTGLVDPNERPVTRAAGVTAHNISAAQEWLRREDEKDAHEKH